eukprot:472129_1
MGSKNSKEEIDSTCTSKNKNNSIEYLRFGRYEGIWRNEEINFEYELVIDENNFQPHTNINKHSYAFEGFLEWRATDLPNRCKSDIGVINMEKVRGFYYNYKNKDKQQYKMICMGYELYKSKPPDECKITSYCDGYKFDLNPKYETIDSYCCHHGKWDNKISIKRVASKYELIQLLTHKFGNEKGIVGIVSEMLHKYTSPIYPHQSYNDKMYKVNLRILLSYQNEIIKPLFDDILDYKKEFDVVSTCDFSPATNLDELDMKTGDKYVVIYQHPPHINQWFYVISDDVKNGWVRADRVKQLQV